MCDTLTVKPWTQRLVVILHLTHCISSRWFHFRKWDQKYFIGLRRKISNPCCYNIWSQHMKSTNRSSFSCPEFTSGQKINSSIRRLLTPTVDRNITQQWHACPSGTKTSGLLQCFAGKPNTALLYIAGLFTLCMTARVKSHDSRYMSGRTHTHTQTHMQ